MAPPLRTGESSSSIAFSMNPRDSRVVSIYDKYLYDPKDLESSDPRRRELARKASQLKLHGRPANNLDANGLRGSNMSSSTVQRKGTDANALAASGAGASHQRPSQQSDQAHDRDSGAFGLGLGMLGGSDSESDSDSDDDRLRSNKPGRHRVERSQDSHRPESWTDRAVAVGHRPPDNASQNPPSLKLMALKSGRQTSVLSNTSQDDRNSRLDVDKNFVDRTSRHGSTIGFAGPTVDHHSPSKPAESHDASKRLSARRALTKQLGLVSPNPTPINGGASPDHRAGPQDYFDSRAPSAAQARSQPHDAGPPPIDIARAQQHGFISAPHSARGTPSPMGSQHGSVATPNSATPLRSPAYGPAGMPSPHHHPLGSGAMPPNVLQRGPPSPYGQRGPNAPNTPGGPGAPYQQSYDSGPNRPMPHVNHPSSLQSGAGARPPHNNNMQRGPGPQGQMGAGGRGPPGANGQFGPSFSDAAGPSKRQSIFRRSMAMFGGGGPQAGPPGNGPGSQNGSRAQPGQKRQSFFRRSMAMLTGGHPNNVNGPPPQRGQHTHMPVPNPPRAPSAPRVHGLQDDFEKPDHPRKSQYLGAGGEGAEWDTNGEGAKFWRRFSMAQKTAGTHKLEDGSRKWMASMASGRRKLIVMGVIALVTLVGVIVGVIVWREIVAPSGSETDEPASIYKANLGAKSSISSASSSVQSATATGTRKASSATSTANSNYSSRSLHADAIIGDVVKRHHRAIAHDVGAPRMRKRHFGRAIAATQPQQHARLVEVN